MKVEVRDSSYMAILKSIAIFKEIPENDLADLFPHLEEIEVEAGELIFKKEEVGQTMYMVDEIMTLASSSIFALCYPDDRVTKLLQDLVEEVACLKV